MPLAEKSEKACSTREIYIEKEVQPPSKIARTLKHEENYLRAIPRAQQYEKSFMHRDVITHVFATQNDFIITASQDGHLKFWKKKYNEGVEFVKHYRCHLGAFADIALNHNGVLMATCCLNDRTVKIFDVQQFDMINMFKLNFSPRVLCWIHKGSDLINALAIGDVNSGKISVFDGNSGSAELHVIENVHQKPIILMKCAPERDVVISIDEGKMIEYWSGPKNNYGFPKSVSWEFKTDTDLYEFCKLKQTPVSLVISPNGQTFTIVSAERFVFIFDLSNARIIDKLDETLQHYIDTGKETKSHGLPTMEWNRRIAIEKEMSRDSEVFRSLQLAYDYTGNFLIYPTPLGINVYNIVTREVVRKLGFGENVRFLGVAICRATPSITEKLGAATTANIEAANNPLFRISEPDPMMIACAYKKNRFYIFTNVEPYSLESDETSNRDVFNEKPLKEDMITAVEEKVPQIKLCNYATIYTTYGDIHIELYPDKCPKTVENFCTHAKQGYYNGHVFHRVIKSFMIQTGDPTGRGTGGESIWGEDFEDEFHPLLRHDKAFRVSMANAGPNTNGSQFFITVCPAEWLDGKNTIFGQVVEGFNVVQKINQVPTYERTGRPKEDISIISISQKNV